MDKGQKEKFKSAAARPDPLMRHNETVDALKREIIKRFGRELEAMKMTPPNENGARFHISFDGNKNSPDEVPECAVTVRHGAERDLQHVCEITLMQDPDDPGPLVSYDIGDRRYQLAHLDPEDNFSQAKKALAVALARVERLDDVMRHMPKSPQTAAQTFSR